MLAVRGVPRGERAVGATVCARVPQLFSPASFPRAPRFVRRTLRACDRDRGLRRRRIPLVCVKGDGGDTIGLQHPLVCVKGKEGCYHGTVTVVQDLAHSCVRGRYLGQHGGRCLGGGLVRRLLRQHALADSATGEHANNREGRGEQKKGEKKDARVLT